MRWSNSWMGTSVRCSWNILRTVSYVSRIFPRADHLPFAMRKTYLVLSGGFGSSSYVRQRLLHKYNDADSQDHSNAIGMQILVADEPCVTCAHKFSMWSDDTEPYTSHRQLVVVHGLVLDRIQQIKRGVATFGSRCSPVSYGIVCDKIYNPEKHVGEPVRLDPRDKITYAIDQIDWLVIQVHTRNHGIAMFPLCSLPWVLI